MIQLPDQYNTRQTRESSSHYFIDTDYSMSDCQLVVFGDD